MPRFFVNIKRNFLYSRILLYITIIVISTIFVTSTVQYYNSRDNTIKQISSFYTDSLKQVGYSAKFMTNSAKSLISQLYLDPDISALINFSDPDDLVVNTGIRRLNFLTTSFDFIQSIYIYNGANKTFYTSISSESIMNEYNFFDQGLVSMFKAPQNIIKVSPISRKVLLPGVPNSEKNFTSVFSFIYFELAPDGLIDSAIVVNVSEQWLRKVINSIDSVNGGNIFVIDSKGCVLSSDSNYIKPSIPLTSGFIGKILSCSSDSGYFTLDIGGENFVITYVSSTDLGWKFIRTSPLSKILEQANKLMKKTVLFSIFILLLGLLVSFFLSRIVYKPIDSVLSKLKMQLAQSNQDKYELKNTYLRKLILNESLLDKNSLKLQLDKHEINLSLENKVTLLLFRIDHFSEFCSKLNSSDRSLMKFAVINILSEICSKAFLTEAVDMGEDYIVMILNIDRTNPHYNYTEFELLIKDIQNSVEKYLNISLTAVLSSSQYLQNGCVHIYNDVLDFSNYRLKFGHKSIIDCESLYKDNAPYIFPVEKGKLLFDSLMLGKIDMVKSIFDDIMNSVQEFSYTVCSSTLMRIAFIVISVVENMDSIGGSHIQYNINKFMVNINTAETLIEIRSIFFDTFNTIFLSLDKKKINKLDSLVNTITEMIDKNYNNESLCLEFIADSLSMSAAYLGRIFKKQIGKPVSDYINEVRINRAKELLSETDKPVNEITSLTGFISSTYFYTIFKKKYGLTPNEYRQKNRTMSTDL